MIVVTKTRDLRIDLARGLCLWFILVDHTIGNVLSRVTLRNFTQCSAADVFVFLCGVSAVLAYGGKFDRAGWWEASKSVLRKVRTIYLAHLALIATLVVFLVAGRALGQAEIERFLWLQGQAVDTAGLLRLATLIDQPGFLEILPLYIVLLSWFALILPLIKRPLCLLVLSGGLWGTVHAHVVGTWIGVTFNPVAWQLTFTLGVLCCRYAHLLRRAELRHLDVAAIGLLAAGVCAHLVLPSTWEAYDQISMPLRTLLRGVGGRDLDPGRVISVLALAWVVFRHVPRDAPWMHTRWAATLIDLGQRSLPVFAVGVALSGLSNWALFAGQQSLATEVVVNIVDITSLVATARLSKTSVKRDHRSISVSVRLATPCPG